MATLNLEQRARDTTLLERIERMLAGLMREQDKSPSPFKEGQIHALEQIRAIVTALRQQPASVDLEQFRLPVEAWKSHLDPNDDDESEAYDEADRLLSIIDNAGKLCPCGEATCTESWEPGCGLGESVEHAVPAEREPPRGDELRAILAHQPAPVVDDAMVERYLAAQAKAVHEIYDACGNGGKATAYLHPVREACRVGLTAALGRMHEVDTTGVLRGNADLVPAEHTYLSTRPENNHESY